MIEYNKINFCTKIRTYAEKVAAIYHFAALTGKTSSGMALDNAIKQLPESLEYNIVIHSASDTFIAAVPDDGNTANYKCIPFADMKNIDAYLKPNRIEIQLNEKVRCTVSKNTITVAGEVFPINIIDQLVAARHTLMN